MTPDVRHPRPFVRSEHHEAEVDSTNDWARRLIVDGTLGPTPALAWADGQTRGRGQGSNTWWSDEGSLTASVVVDPEALGLAIAVRPRVALGVAAAMVDAVEELAPGTFAGIRWPNDVEVAGRKLGGVLVEGVPGPAGPLLVVGFGLNVGTRLDRAPREVRAMATSLAEAGLTPNDRAAALHAILGRLGPMFEALAAGDPALVATWNRLDALRGATIRVQAGPDRFTAEAAGIDPGGGLRIVRDGRAEVLHAGRILRD